MHRSFYLNMSKLRSLNTAIWCDTWFEDFKVSYIHRSMQEILKDIIDSDFDLIDFIEPKPTDTCREADPVFWEIHQKIPLFMVFDLLKK